MRRSVSCVSAYLKGREEADMWSLRFGVFVCKLAATLVNSSKNQCALIIVFVLVFELRVTLHLRINLNTAIGLLAQAVLYFKEYEKV